MTHRDLRTDSANNISDILGECLRAIEAGEATVEGCIARYPGNPELAHLLNTMTTVQQLPRPLLPVADKAAMRQQVMAKYRAQQATARPQVRRDTARRMPRWAQFAIAFSLVVVILLSGGVGLVRAAESTVPGDGLYGVKRLTEQVELSFADGQARPDLLYRMAQTRLTELDTLSERHRSWTAEELADLTTSIRIAIAVKPDKARQLIDTTNSVLYKAETAGTLATGKRTEVLQALPATPDAKSDRCVPCATLIATTNAQPAAASSETPTATGTPTMTPTPTMTSTPTMTPTAEPTAQSTDASGLQPGSKAANPGQPSKTSPTPGVGNNNSNSNGGQGSTDNSGNSGDNPGSGKGGGKK